MDDEAKYYGLKYSSLEIGARKKLSITRSGQFLEVLQRWPNGVKCLFTCQMKFYVLNKPK